MAIDRTLWQPSFEALPSWVCPTCGSGNLRLLDATWAQHASGPTTLANNPHDWEPEWLEDRFSGLLECQNSNCGDVVAIGGRVTHSRGYDHERQETLFERLRPTQLSPAPHLFRIPDDCPDEVRKELKLAFTLIWQDVGSATNRLRVAVEALLTDRGIARTTIDKKGKRVPLSLHSRIESTPSRTRVRRTFSWPSSG